MECHIVLDHEPLLHPDPTFVGLSRCVFSNVVSFKVYSGSKLSVEVSRNDSDVFFVVAVGLDVFVLFLDVHVRVSGVIEIHTGQSDLALIGLYCCGDHPFADVHDFSFQEF